ncbi:hypothetical protein OCHUTO_1134 [Orientia chuto str. Dubai]|uniref:Uncharacterized protein n=1 Tax=Orientia chuto str. Dubai TaxID=1359168 RepID=A0A0F3MIQ9_9RICK|nr:hypothetical protein [Candidatus Orientia mediorientalis]KJV54484.1 hypothetical protein OCHUTO_1134 [Orientia chuto str. Dubai]
MIINNNILQSLASKVADDQYDNQDDCIIARKFNYTQPLLLKLKSIATDIDIWIKENKQDLYALCEDLFSIRGNVFKLELCPKDRFAKDIKIAEYSALNCNSLLELPINEYSHIDEDWTKYAVRVANATEFINSVNKGACEIMRNCISTAMEATSTVMTDVTTKSEIANEENDPESSSSIALSITIFGCLASIGGYCIYRIYSNYKSNKQNNDLQISQKNDDHNAETESFISSAVIENYDFSKKSFLEASSNINNSSTVAETDFVVAEIHQDDLDIQISNSNVYPCEPIYESLSF